MEGQNQRPLIFQQHLVGGSYKGGDASFAFVIGSTLFLWIGRAHPSRDHLRRHDALRASPSSRPFLSYSFTFPLFIIFKIIVFSIESQGLFCDFLGLLNKIKHPPTILLIFIDMGAFQGRSHLLPIIDSYYWIFFC